MVSRYYSVVLMTALLVLMSNCQNPSADDSHTHGEATHGPHEPEPELEPTAFTVWTNKSELFVEFPPLIVGRSSSFAAHFSEMTNFGAIESGRVIVRLWDGDRKVVENGSPEPSSPGIFRPSLLPSESGHFSLQFVLLTDEFNDTITLRDIVVYPDIKTATAANPPSSGSDEISFLKEQAWKIDFAIDQVKRQPIRDVIRTSGEIQPVKSEEKIIAAMSSGIVFFKSRNLQVGRNVRLGESLFSISSKGLVQSNIEEKYQVAKAHFEKTKADFERAESLLDEQIIGQKDYELRKMEFSVASAEFQTLVDAFDTNGQSVASTISGIVKSVLVSDGQFVEEGAPLIAITNNRRLILRANVSQDFLPKLRMVNSANFKTSYQQQIQSIDDYNGKLVSYGNVIDQGTGFIPVEFELDNLHELIPGSFVELFLLTTPSANDLVISRSALMQDYDSYYVYVQTGGESFEKRQVKLGIDDGIKVQILSGLTEDEWVVTKGAYQIKMASMSSTIPAHGHEH